MKAISKCGRGKLKNKKACQPTEKNNIELKKTKNENNENSRSLLCNMHFTDFLTVKLKKPFSATSG